MWEHMGVFGGWGMGFGMLLFWGLLFAAVVMLVKCSQSAKQNQEKSALDILKERYARGEIQRDEFEQKKRDLEG